MAKRGSRSTRTVTRTRPEEAAEILKAIGFGPKQSNEVAAYTLLALLDVRPKTTWSAATNPLRGITPIIEFVHEAYAVRYAPNTRETIRDEAVKYFVESGLVIRNPDDPEQMWRGVTSDTITRLDINKIGRASCRERVLASV